ncbi:MAG: integrase [Hungatella sp.]|nr:integrase [Hungatella sp.]
MEFQVLKAIMGHSKLSITMDLYAHVLPDAKSKETQKISALFGV